MTDFCSRLERRIEQHGPLCVGIDPSAATLAKCELPDSPQGAFEFGSRVLEATEYQVAIVKPQAAYFERFGSSGVRALEELVALARRKDLLVLLDAKRGDIDTTGEAYAEAFFSPSSPLKVDAVTLHPFLGPRRRHIRRGSIVKPGGRSDTNGSTRGRAHDCASFVRRD